MGEIKYQGRKKTRHSELSVMFFPSAFVCYVPLPDVKYPSIYKVFSVTNSTCNSPYCGNAHDDTILIHNPNFNVLGNVNNIFHLNSSLNRSSITN